MQLDSVQILRYRSIDDSGEFSIEPDVTCLVGKNESGKTATLNALYKSLPVGDDAAFNLTMDFPSHLTRELRAISNSPTVTELKYLLEDDDVKAVEEAIGPNTLSESFISYSTNYDGTANPSVSIDREKVTKYLLKQVEDSLSDSAKELAQKATTPKELVDNLTSAVDGSIPSVTSLIQTVSSWKDSDPASKAIEILNSRRPRFVYYEDYDVMPGHISIPYLINQKSTNNLTRGQKALLALLSLAGVELTDLSDTDFTNSEQQIRKLENASNAISDEVFNYWSQNKELSVKLTLLPGPDPATVGSGNLIKAGPFLQVRVQNDRHRVTVPFDERSRGFVWFFSFLAYFSQIESESTYPLVLLLDEPGLSLHATAQHDLLRFIRERLAPRHQVVFSTHSPFMVDSHKFGEVRTVIDTDEKGTVVSADVLRADSESAFPLHAAMGVELTQTLFVGPTVLFVEGPSDLIYLNYFSEAVKSHGHSGLNPNWTIVPGGGLAKLPVFLSLFGSNNIRVAVLTDSSVNDTTIIRRLRETGRVFNAGLISIGTVLDRTEADIEDLFSTEYYLALVNRAFAGALKGYKIKSDDLPEDSRIVNRVSKYFADHNINNGHLNHYSPAAELLRSEQNLPDLDSKTIDRVTTLLNEINSVLN